MNRPEGISESAWEKAEQVAKEATRDAIRDPLMPYYITVTPHIARAIQSSVEAENDRCARIALRVTKSPSQSNAKSRWVEDIGMVVFKAIKGA